MKLLEKITLKKAKVGVVGLGYVGLPLVLEFCSNGFSVTGFDVDSKKINALEKGESYLKHIENSQISAVSNNLYATTDFSQIADVDIVILCLPTPLTKHREPDMTYIEGTAHKIKEELRKEHLIILESTTYPGTTNGLLKNILEESGLKAGEDFYLGYSPEREDPNNQNFNIKTIPKVVSGLSKNCLELVDALYSHVVDKTVPVSSTETAEATKLLENIYRTVNIAMVNEQKMLFDEMGIDIWEVINAASTKPFGFQPFYPGPGLGGHCLPIDPFYLTWKAKEFDISTKFIELAGEINTYMPRYVVGKTASALNKISKSINGSNILILGAAYKKDVDDCRESPFFKLKELLKERGAVVDYNDPYLPTIGKTRDYDVSKSSVELTAQNLAKYDCVIISTDHSVYDADFIGKHSKMIVDTRNLMHGYGDSNKVVQA